MSKVVISEEVKNELHKILDTNISESQLHKLYNLLIKR